MLSILRYNEYFVEKSICLPTHRTNLFIYLPIYPSIYPSGLIVIIHDPDIAYVVLTR